jgi:hypothetical protein
VETPAKMTIGLLVQKADPTVGPGRTRKELLGPEQIHLLSLEKSKNMLLI